MISDQMGDAVTGGVAGGVAVKKKKKKRSAVIISDEEDISGSRSSSATLSASSSVLPDISLALSTARVNITVFSFRKKGQKIGCRESLIYIFF